MKSILVVDFDHDPEVFNMGGEILSGDFRLALNALC